MKRLTLSLATNEWRCPLRVALIALIAITFAQAAMADCTPGYKDSVDFHCDPNQNANPTTHVYPRYTTKSSHRLPQGVVQSMACPPGTQRYQGHCAAVPSRPGRAKPQSRYMETVAPHQGGIVPITTKHHSYPVEREIVDRNKVAPVTGPGPRHDSGGTHGIIFVGGHSQSTIDHDKAALNPQPIPPGHSLRRIPNPGSPIEKKIGH